MGSFFIFVSLCNKIQCECVLKIEMCRMYGEYPGSKRRANEFLHIVKDDWKISTSVSKMVEFLLDWRYKLVPQHESR